MSFVVGAVTLFCLALIQSSAAVSNKSCAISSEQTEEFENQEAAVARLELLQRSREKEGWEQSIQHEDGPGASGLNENQSADLLSMKQLVHSTVALQMDRSEHAIPLPDGALPIGSTFPTCPDGSTGFECGSDQAYCRFIDHMGFSFGTSQCVVATTYKSTPFYGGPWTCQTTTKWWSPLSCNKNSDCQGFIKGWKVKTWSSNVNKHEYEIVCNYELSTPPPTPAPPPPPPTPAPPPSCRCYKCGGTVLGQWKSGSCDAGGTSAGGQCKRGEIAGCYSSLDDYDCLCNYPSAGVADMR